MTDDPAADYYNDIEDANVRNVMKASMREHLQKSRPHEEATMQSYLRNPFSFIVYVRETLQEHERQIAALEAKVDALTRPQWYSPTQGRYTPSSVPAPGVVPDYTTASTTTEPKK